MQLQSCFIIGYLTIAQMHLFFLEWSLTCGWRVSEIHFGTFLVVFTVIGFSRFLWSGLFLVAPSGPFHRAEPKTTRSHSQTDRGTTNDGMYVLLACLPN